MTFQVVLVVEKLFYSRETELVLLGDSHEFIH